MRSPSRSAPTDMSPLCYWRSAQRRKACAVTDLPIHRSRSRLSDTVLAVCNIVAGVTLLYHRLQDLAAGTPLHEQQHFVNDSGSGVVDPRASSEEWKDAGDEHNNGGF